MPEIDKAADEALVAMGGQQPPVPEDHASAARDELSLEKIEGLADEARSMPGPPSRAEGRDDRGSPEISAIVDAVKGLGDQLGRRLESLQTTLERESRAEATRERVVDRLHAELQEYKQDFLLKVQRPIFIDLIQLHDDIGKVVDARLLSGTDLERAADVRGLLEPIQAAIEDILYRQGVEPFVLEGTEFDPRKQRAVSTQATDEPALNKKVAARLRKGFASGEKLIRPEIVTVFTFRPPPAAGDD